MHFSTIAVSILAKSLPIVALGGDGAAWRKKRERAVIKRKKYLADLASLARRDARNNKLDAVLVKTPEEAHPTKTTSSSNIAPTEKGERQQCVPLSGEPDTGIFSCGSDSRCVASKESSLGGVCIAFKKAQALHRAMQDADDQDCYTNQGATFTDGVTTCDCTQYATYMGTYTCQYLEPYCIDPAEQICSTLSFEVTVSGPQSFSVTYCLDFGADATVEEFCYSLNYEGETATSCMFEANDVTCESCSITPCSPEKAGAVIDCSNTELKVSGNTCEARFLQNAILAANQGETGMPTTPPAPSISPMPSSEMSDLPTAKPVLVFEPMMSAASSLKEKLTTTGVVLAAAWGLALA